MSSSNTFMPSYDFNPFANDGSRAESSNYRNMENASMENGEPRPQPSPPMTNDPSFDILEWHPAYQSCQRYFLDHSQHEPGTQALCALINIRLPCQWLDTPITTSNPNPTHPSSSGGPAYSFNPTFPLANSSNLNSPSRSRNGSTQHPSPVFVSLTPYIRRLVVTAFDKPAILHGFFGDDYSRGVLPHVECERRNYLFAAKHGGWRSCKKQYDGGSRNGAGVGGDETVPFMKPLDEARAEELTAAEREWSKWLAMEDWMVGPRAPEEGSTIGHEREGGEEGWSRRRGGGEQLHDGGRDDAYRAQ